ncbi:MAG: hypothetical protein ACYCYE_00830 [Clostridia bacterium]
MSGDRVKLLRNLYEREGISIGFSEQFDANFDNENDYFTIATIYGGYI